MRRVIRSIIDVGGTLSSADLLINYERFAESRLEWTRPDDVRILTFITEWYANRNEPPTIETIRRGFEGRVNVPDDMEVIARLEDVAAAQCYIRTNFAHLLASLWHDQLTTMTFAALAEAREVIARGGVHLRGGVEQLAGRLLELWPDIAPPIVNALQEISPPRTEPVPEAQLRFDFREPWWVRLDKEDQDDMAADSRDALLGRARPTP